MEEITKIRSREEIPVEDTWATEDLYPSDEAWEAELATLEDDKALLSGFAGHLKVAAGSIIGGGAGVPSSIEKPDYYAGYMPAMPHREFYNILSVIKRLPEMRRQLKHLAEKVDSLKKE